MVTALEKYKEVHEGIALRWRTDAAKVADKFLNAPSLPAAPKRQKA